MPHSRQEIQQNAVKFAQEWASENREEAEAQSFWNEFFAVFGFMDLFWSGRLPD